MAVLRFVVNEIFGQGAIFLAFIACVGLLVQKKPLSDIIRGTAMTAIGFFILSTGTGIITGSSIDGIAQAFGAIMPEAAPSQSVDIAADYGSQIGIVMILAFACNLLVARFTRWKSIFLTGHMLYWFPFVFIAAGVNAGLAGWKLVALATLFTATYMVVSPNLMRPFVRKVTGSDSFTIGHPTTCLSVTGGLLARWLGNPARSTEDLKIPKSLGFLREVAITGSLTITAVYIVMYALLVSRGLEPAVIWGYAGSGTGAFTYIFTHSVYFGVGITIMLQGVRMLIGEIIPAFKGIAERFVPDSIPALDVPVIFPYGPNALIIGFIVSMITSTLTILVSAGWFPTVIIPLVSTCFFEIGCASIIGNAEGGVRGCILSAAVSGVLMVFLVGLGSYFFNNTIQQWMLVYGGQDFSLWGILEGLIASVLA